MRIYFSKHSKQYCLAQAANANPIPLGKDDTYWFKSYRELIAALPKTTKLNQQGVLVSKETGNPVVAIISR